MATHSSTLAWKIPWTEKPGRLQSMGSQRVSHDRVTKQCSTHWQKLRVFTHDDSDTCKTSKQDFGYRNLEFDYSKLDTEIGILGKRPINEVIICGLDHLART